MNEAAVFFSYFQVNPIFNSNYYTWITKNKYQNKITIVTKLTSH